MSAPGLARLSAARAFLALAVLYGAAFLVLTPPLQAPDEIRHLLRAYMISEGQLLAQARADGYAGGSVPRDVLALDERLAADLRHRPERRLDRARLRRELARPREPGERVEIALPSLYTPLAYLPQAGAILLGRLAGWPVVVLAGVGRLANLAVWIALTHRALRLAPAHAWTLALVALAPMSLFEAASLSADCLTNALSFLWLAAVLRASAPGRRDPLGGREAAGLLALAALVGLAKQAYWPLVGCVLLVPRERFASPRRRAAVLALVVLGSAVPVAAWFAWLRGLELAPLAHSADPQAQLRFVLAQPALFAETLARTLVQHFPRYVRTFVGVLGSLDAPLPAFLYLAYPLLLVGVAVGDGGARSPVRGRGRAVVLASAAATWLFAMTLAYLGWNAVGDWLVRYVQGRYFIPLVPLLLAALHAPRGSGLPPAARGAALLAAAATLTVACAVLLRRYHLG